MKSNIISLIIFGLIIAKTFAQYGESSSLFCLEVDTQRNVDIEHILGMWYGGEIITHSQNDPTGVHYYDTCVVVHLTDITDQMSTTTERQRDYKSYSRIPHYEGTHRYLRLIWDENGNNLEYTLQYNTTRTGFWLSLGNQKGTMLDLQYQQFSGTLQVVKAVRDHLVLTFCHKVLNSNLFSIILSREPNSLSFDDYSSIHNMLQRRGLTTNTIRKVCASGGVSGSSHLEITFGIILISISMFV